jgi:ketosteroid isomerase-like protein
MSEPITPQTLAAFGDAWSRHDLDALMSFMHDDCVFLTAAGPGASGTRHAGREAVRAAFPGGWATVPDARWEDAEHFVFGDHGVSTWTYRGTSVDGARVEVDGIDLFTFRDGKILVKNTFRKTRTAPPAP